jgi:predicted GNAT family N-acyltransferase
MININKNETVKKFMSLFNKEKNFTCFEKAFVFEKFIEEVLQFNRHVNWDPSFKNIHLVSTAEELVKVYQLRSQIYGDMGYQDEFPDYLPNMNFDFYDENAAIIYTKANNEINATCRLIFDSEKQLPLEKKLNLSDLRDKLSKVSEISRLMVKKKSEGLNLDFKYLMAGMYMLKVQNNLDASISIVAQDHFKLYGKLGGFTIERDLPSYGHLDKPFVIISWDLSEISRFFQKAFLK